MAERFVKIVTDDMEAAEGRESEATSSRLIGLDGVWRKIDLNAKNDGKLVGLLQPYWDNARPASLKKGHTKSAPSPKHTGSGLNSEQLKAVREWARKNNWPNLSDRGRVPAEAIAAFEASGGLTANPDFSAQ